MLAGMNVWILFATVDAWVRTCTSFCHQSERQRDRSTNKKSASRTPSTSEKPERLQYVFACTRLLATRVALLLRSCSIRSMPKANPSSLEPSAGQTRGDNSCENNCESQSLRILSSQHPSCREDSLLSQSIESTKYKATTGDLSTRAPRYS